jgi:lipid II isoglutaminyl synthase (glutamine-hydrolysing)
LARRGSWQPHLVKRTFFSIMLYLEQSKKQKKLDQIECAHSAKQKMSTTLGSNPLQLRIMHLYARFLNIYGDRGNLITMQQRGAWRGIEVVTKSLDLGESIDPDWADFYFVGGGQDKQQQTIAFDLLRHGKVLHEAINNGAVLLAVCGGYQLLGDYYRPHEGDELKGISLLDAYTVAGHRRLIGNVQVKQEDGNTLVGFENHSGKTYLGSKTKALGKVTLGNGNNGEDGQEGANFGKVYGTYLHGSLLPKNPQFADRLIGEALSRRYGLVELSQLDDSLENLGHKRALALPA